MRWFRPAFFVSLVGAGCVSALFPLGCASILGLDDTTLREDASLDAKSHEPEVGPGGGEGGIADAGTDAHTEPLGCEPPPSDAGFVVQWTTGWRLPDGGYSKCAKTALRPDMVEVRVLTNVGFTEPKVGTVVKNALVFAGLPDGDRYVHVPSVHQLYVVRGGHGLDMGYDEIGRPDATKGTGEKLRTKASPTQISGTWRLGGTVSSPPLMPQNAYSEWPYEFRGAPLLDGTKGDVVWLLGTLPDEAIKGEKVAEVCTPSSPTTMRPNETTEVTAPCSTVPLQSLIITNAYGSFERSLPGEVADEGVVHIDTAPSGDSHLTSPNGGWNDARSEDNRLARATIVGDAGDLTMDVMLPAPSETWVVTAEEQVWKTHSIVRVDGSPSTRQWRDVASSAQAIIGNRTLGWNIPALPGEVIVHGKDLLKAPATGITTTPTIKITLASGVYTLPPTGYRIAIVEVMTGNKRYEIITSQNEVTVPPLSPDILENGKEYVLEVTTRFAGGLTWQPMELYSEEEPWRVIRRNDLRMAYMTRVTNAFIP
ncbi:hypothetical protein LZC95_25830 [Pendulispora brunnea]|uniref:Uncharacterized protein n=1 Tax=Pendulispora brunnea TaxID=2905690 RepID=A0ABZ2JTW6_9BACT